MIELRLYEQADIPRIAELANNENVSRYLVYTFPHPYTTQDAQWWVNVGAAEDGAVTRAIVFENALVGTVGVQPEIGWKNHSAEIGYWVGEPYWGKGIATQALEQMTQLAFEELGFRRLFAPVLGPNEASMRVLQKCGYEKEGVFKSEVHKNGRFYDTHHYARYCIQRPAEPDA